MVGIVSGNGLGLFNSSLDVLGLDINQTRLGQANGATYANIATGNLSLQFLDESISGTGADMFALRTYNSLGALTDGDADGWRWEGEKRITLTGTANTTSAVVTRTLGDGSQTIYKWDGVANSNNYVSTAGSGAHDNITQSASSLNWYFYENGTNNVTEIYSGTTGWISTMRDTVGNGFNYVFTNNKLTSITDLRSSQRFDFIYNGTGGRLSELKTFLVSSATDTGTLLTQVRYTYHPSGLLATVTTDLSPEDNSVADGKVYTTSYTYDSSNRVTSVAQSDGTTASFTYYEDGTNRIKTASDQMGTTIFNYGTLSTTVTNGAGDVWTYTYDADKQLRKVESTAVNGVKQSSEYTYYANGDVQTVKDGRGNITTYTYDTRGNRIKEVDQLGNTITRTFTSKNSQLTETRYTGTSTTSTLPTGAETTRYIYNSLGKVRFTVSPEGRVSELVYNSLGLVAETRQYSGPSRYTATGSTEANLTAWAAALPSTEKSQIQLTTFQYDYRGNLSQKMTYASLDSNGVGIADIHTNPTKYIYDAYGRLLQTIVLFEDGNSFLFSSTTYDGMGRQTGSFSESGTTVTTYAGNQITTINTSSNLTTVITNNSSGLITSIAKSGDGTTRTTNYYYDNAGRLRMTQDPMGSRSYLFYDAAGRISFKVDPHEEAQYGIGRATGYTYDADARLLTETQYWWSPTTNGWFNSATSQVTKSSLSVGDDTQTFDILSVASADRTITYIYDEAGRLKTKTNPSQLPTTNTYDGESRLIKTEQGDRTTRYFYDKDGRQTGLLNAEGYLSENVYDGVGRLLQTIRYAGKVSDVTAAFSALRSSALAASVPVGDNKTLSSFYYYDSAGRQVGVVDEHGFLTETVYLENGWNDGDIYREVIKYSPSSTSSIAITSADDLSAARIKAGAVLDRVRYYYNLTGQLTGSYSFTTGTESRNIYDSAGRLIQQIEAIYSSDQRATRTRYNAFGDVTGIVSGVGEATLVNNPTASQITTAINNYGTRYDIDGAGRKIAEYGPNGQKTLLYYDTAGRLTYTVNALGEASWTRYNPFGQLASIYYLTNQIDISGLTGGAITSDFDSSIKARIAQSINYSKDKIVSTSYNWLGLLDHVGGSSDEFEASYQYNGYGELSMSTQYTQTSPSIVAIFTEYGYDKLGRQTYVKDNTQKDIQSSGLGILSNQTVYDGFGRIVNSIDGNNKTTVTSYSNSGRTITVADPLGRTNSIDVDALGRTVKSYDGFGNITNYTYNDSTRSLTISTPEGSSVTTTKTRTGEIFETKDSNGNIIRYSYTKDGKLDTTTNVTTGVVLEDNEYDQSGRLTDVKDANLVVTHYEYDAANKVTSKTIDPTGLNIRTTYAFDGQGRQILVTEGAGTSAAMQTQYKYDQAGRIKQIIVDPKSINTLNDNPNGLDLATTFTYNKRGETLSVEKGTVANPSQQKTVFIIDKLGRKTSEIVDPTVSGYTGLNITTLYKYDDKGNVTRIIDSNNNSTWFIYDAAGQKTQQIDALGNVTTFEYDKNGKLYHTRQYATALSDTVLSGLGDIVTNITLPSANDTNDHRSYTVYDKNGRSRYTLTAANADGWIVTETIYDANNNIIESRSYDKPISNTNVTSITAAGSTLGALITTDEMATQLAALGYGLSLGDSRVTRYVYDANNRLRFSIDTLGYVTETQYDANGNVTSTRQYAKPVNLPTIGSTDNKTLSLSGDSGWLSGSDHVAINTSKTYTVRAKVRQLSGTGSIYVGVMTYDSSGNLIVNPNQANYSYAAANNVLLTPEMGWQTFSGTITGVDPVALGASMNKFLAGSVSAAPLLLYNYYADGSGDLGRVVELDSLEFIDNATGAVLNVNSLMTDGTSHWGSNFGFEGVNNTTIGLTDVQFKKLLRPDAGTDRITSYVYDKAGRLTSTTNAEGAVTENIYDSLGHVTRVIQHNGAVSPTSSYQLNGAISINGWSILNQDIVDLQYTDTRKARLTKNGDLWISEGSGTEYKVAENVDSFQISGTRIGILKKGTLFIYEGAINNSVLTASWVSETYPDWNVNQFQLDGDSTSSTTGRIGVMVNGTLWVKEGIYGGWAEEWPNEVSSFQLEGNRIAVLTKSGELKVKEGALNAGWISEQTNVTDFQLKGTRIGVLVGSQLFVKEGGLSTNWTSQGTDVTRFQLEGNRIAKLSNGQLFVRDIAVGSLNDGTTSNWGTNIESNITSFKLAGARIAVLQTGTTGNNFGVKDASGGFVWTPAGVQTYTLSNTFVGAVYGLDDRITSYSYDKAGRQIKTTLAGWYDQKDGRVYSASEGQASRFQRTVEVTYDAMGNAIANKIRTGLNDFTYQYKTYDKAGREVHDIDGLGYVSKKIYDAMGNVKYQYRFNNSVNVKNNGYWSTAEVDSAVTNYSVRVLEFRYDKLGRQAQIIQPYSTKYYEGGFWSAAAVTVNSYDAFGNLTKQAQQVGSTTADTYFYYDRLGRKIFTVDAEKYGTKNEYNAFGNVLRTTEYALATTDTISISSFPTYIDNLTATQISQYGDNRVTQYTFNTLGQVKTTSRKINGAMTQVGSQNYNAFGELETTYSFDANNALNNVTKMEYNKLGKLTKLTEPTRDVAGTAGDVFLTKVTNVSPVTTIVYDAFGQAKTETRSTSSTAINSAIPAIVTEHQYDVAGNEIATKDGVGNWSYSGYDVSGKVIRQWQAVSVTGTSTETNYSYTIDRRYEYDNAGRQISSLDIFNNGTQKSGQVNIYNGYGEVIEERKVWGNSNSTTAQLMSSETNNVIVNAYGYDAAGQMSVKHSSEGYINYFYDLAGHLTLIRQQEAAISNSASDRLTENQYDKLGRVLVQKLPVFSATTGNQTSITDTTYVPPSATPIITRTYDRWGNRLTESGDTVNNGSSYSYNQDNQLTKEQLAATSVLQLNATDTFKSIQVSKSTQYNLQGQITSVVESAKDVAANTTVQRTSITNNYNSVGQLLSTMDATGVTTSYIYDANGNRVGTKDAVGHVAVDQFNNNNQIISHSLLRNGATSEYKSGDTNVTLTLVNLATYKYDQAGRRYAEADAYQVPQYYKFDERGNLLVSRNREGASHIYTFDELGNKTSEILSSSSGQTTLNNWSYRDNANANDYVNYMSDHLQSRVIAGDSTQSFRYFYENGFGQLTREENVNGASKGKIVYTYWGNGLQKAIAESTSVDSTDYTQATQGNGSVTITTTSTPYTTTNSKNSYFYYDVRGNKTAEKNETNQMIGAKTVTTTITGTGAANGTNSYNVLVQTSSSGGFIYYKYDGLNRLTEVSSPASDVSINGSTQKSTDLSLLKYDYDEWGNRRRITSTYKVLPATSSSTKVEWYSYDNANRVLVEGGVLVGNQLAANTNQGVVYHYSYGRRDSQEFYKSSAGYSWSGNGTGGGGGLGTDYSYITFTYNDLGLLEETNENIKRRSLGPNNTTLDAELPYTATTYYSNQTGYSTTTYNLIRDVRKYDNRGFLTLETRSSNGATYSTPNNSSINRKIISSYTLDGALKTQQTETVTGTAKIESILTYYYLPSGDIDYYTFGNFDIATGHANTLLYTNSYSYKYINTYAGRQVGSITARTGQAGTAEGSTTNSYDIRGRLTGTSISAIYNNTNGYSYRYFSYNTAGQILMKSERLFAGTNSTTKTQSYYYSPTSGELANVGQLGVDISPLSAIYSPGSTPTSYTVSSGDTLMGIAQSIFGDTKLWYLIADLNGLAMGPTDVFGQADIGRNLRIPNSSQNVGNTSTNYKPYNPAEIIGDLTPSPTLLPPPKAQGCSKIAMVIIVVVAIIATIYTAGASASSLGGATATTTTTTAAGVTTTTTAAAGAGAAGSAALVGGTATSVSIVGGTTVTTAVTMSTATAIGSAFVGGVVGSVASQLAGMALGVTDHFSMRQAWSSGLTAGLTAGAGAALNTFGASVGLGTMGDYGFSPNGYGQMAQGAASYLSAYASNKIAGLETHFNWTDMAVTSISSGLTGKTGNSVSDAVRGLGGDFGANFAGNFWGSTVNSSLSRLTGRGQKQNWGAMAADAFGNALATKVVGAMQEREANKAETVARRARMAEQNKKEMAEMGARWEADANAASDRIGADIQADLERSLADMKLPEVQIAAEAQNTSGAVGAAASIQARDAIANSSNTAGELDWLLGNKKLSIADQINRDLRNPMTLGNIDFNQAAKFIDGPQMSALDTVADQQKMDYQRHSIEIAVGGPLFGGLGAATRVFNGTESQVEGANQLSGAIFDIFTGKAALPEREFSLMKPKGLYEDDAIRLDVATNRTYSSLEELNSLKGTGNNIGNLSDISGKNVLDIIPDIPESATVRVLKPVEGKSQAGLEYKWADEDGITNRLRIHDPDPSYPGSNAANGWIARWQNGGQYYDPIAGNFAHKNAYNINSPFYSPSAANNTHIPIQTPEQWLIDLMLPKK